MQPFPSPLDPVPAVSQNAEIIREAERLTNEVATEVYADSEADLMEALDLIGQVGKKLMSGTSRALTQAEKLVNQVSAKLNAAFEMTPDIIGPIPPGLLPPGAPIPPPVIIPPITPIPPLDPCPPCGPGGPGLPIEPPIIIEPPIDLPKPPDCPPCPGLPVCPDPVPCPIEPPPPPEEPCVPPLHVVIDCLTPQIFGKLGPCEPEPCKAMCDNGAQPPIPPDFPEQPLGGPTDACRGNTCPVLSGTETVQVFTQAPYPLATDGTENAFSECGTAQILLDQAEELDVVEFIGHGGPNGLCNAAAAGISGQSDFSDYVSNVDAFSVFDAPVESPGA